MRAVPAIRPFLAARRSARSQPHKNCGQHNDAYCPTLRGVVSWPSEGQRRSIEIVINGLDWQPSRGDAVVLPPLAAGVLAITAALRASWGRSLHLTVAVA